MDLVTVLTVKPTRALVDEKFHVVVENLPPGQRITLHSSHLSELRDYWEAFGHYVSDANGKVTVSKDASVGGTYEGIEAMGLIWSMRPIPGSKPGLRFRKSDVQTPMVVHISVYKGHLSEGFKEQVALASVVTERWYMAPGVRRVDITDEGITGTLLLPPGPGPFPGIMDMWGGGGGLEEDRAALFASHGFAVMALMYLFPEAEKNATIRLSYFETAFRLLQDHPLVACDRIALLGLSYGGSIVLSLINAKLIKPKCCVCISATHIYPIKANVSVLEASVEMNMDVHKASRDEHNRLMWKNVHLPLPKDPHLKADVGNMKCPLLLVVGQDDQSWSSVESADDIQQMMQMAGNCHLLTILSYPQAGHMIEPPYSPHCYASNLLMRGKEEKVEIMSWGGVTKPHSDAEEDSWEKILGFLRKHLC